MIQVIGQFEILSVFVEQIVDAFIIYFQVGDPNFEIIWIGIRLYSFENISDCTRQKTRWTLLSKHSVCLAWGSLTIHEDATIVAL